MDSLFFAIAPTLPNQGRCLFACQPPVAGLAFRREGHANRAPVKALFCMMVDRSTKSLEVTACAALTAAIFDVSRAGLRVDRRQLLATPKIVEPVDPRFNFKLIAWLADIAQIDRQHVGAVDVVDVSSAALRLILLRDVVC
ncbi:hypothetical protein [Bradyrhizobium sp. RD5-C2]|uniref:hypothetical protein n=1 Tax=Bradyrhizobium sp. RD5-C2 TaxID=244562 RepID=UPI0027E4263A|nr:hypothetical protein [Bradyrhizobium sp. RD5-C2]